MSIVESICQELQKKKNLALVSIVKQLESSLPLHLGMRAPACWLTRKALSQAPLAEAFWRARP